MSDAHAVVLWGANNIYSLRSSRGIREARIKGKKLNLEEASYNPLAPGDVVEVEFPPESPDSALITGRLDRRNSFGRWNKKRQARQTIGANLDELVILASPVSPPFRPRFIDRALALGESEGLTMRIVMNKTDQGIDGDMQERIDYYRSIGYSLDCISVKENRGVDELIAQWMGKTVLLLGQSGVGKSSLVKQLFPDQNVKTAEVSGKYNRGRHTTVLAKSYELDEHSILIDTPGIRELDVYGIPPDDLRFLFVEFPGFGQHCALTGCRHVHEPDCAVKDAVVEGHIHEDRYDSYINTLIVMEQSAKHMKDWKFRKL